jgi:hypothetical protein
MSVAIERSNVAQGTTEALRSRGVEAPAEVLDDALAQALAARQAMLRAPSEGELTPAEAEVLRRGGFALEPRFAPADDPLVRSIVGFAALIKSSLPTAAAARRLRVDPSRVRQRLAERSLYGIRPDGEWLLPAFQFDGGRLVPGIGEALKRLDPELHPLVVEAFFVEPNDELTALRDGHPINPRDWLRAGFDALVVARLAAEL